MKHYVLFFLTLLLGLGTLSASAQEQDDSVQVTLNIDDPARVQADLNGDSVLTLKAGGNTFKVIAWTNLNLSATSGHILDKVVDADGNEQTIDNNGAACTLFIADSPKERTYTVTSSVVTNIHFTLSVDHADKIKVTTADYASVTLHDGDNTLTIPSNNLPIGISSAKWGDDLYEVLLDGEAVAYNYGYTVMPKEGSVVKVATAFPDKDCKLTFSYPEGITNFFTTVSVNGSLVTDFLNGLELKAGDKVKFYYNPAMWSSDPDEAVTVEVNGKQTSWFGSGYSLTLRDNTTVALTKAVPASTISVKVKINKDGATTIYRSSEFYNDIVPLKANEETSVTLPEDDGNKLVVVANGDESIKGINVNGEPMSLDVNNYAEITNLVNGDVVTIFMNNATTSGIGSITTQTGAAPVYNLQGRRMTGRHLPKGIYIRQSRKVIVK